MTAEVSWSETAEYELQEIVDHFIRVADIDEALEVYQQIEHSVLRLADQPELCPVYGEPVRRLVIEDLPYSCFYEFSNGVVYIPHVRHDKRQPESLNILAHPQKCLAPR